MKKEYIIGGALIIGGGLYYAYTKGLLDKFLKPKPTGETAKQQSQETIDEIKQREAADNAAANAAANRAAATSQANSIDNPNSYAGKVAYIQGQINVNPDGNPTGSKGINSNTNKAFESIYGLDKGAISTANIDYYKKRVEDKNTKAAIALAAKQKTSAVNKTITDGKKLIDLVNNKGLTAVLLENVTANKFQLDKLTNSFIDMKSPRNFSKGTKFYKGEFSPIVRGNYVMYVKDGSYYPILPSKFILN